MAILKQRTACNLNVKALLSRMNQPVGNAIGNSMEVREAIQIMKPGNPGVGSGTLRHLCTEFAAQLEVMAGVKPYREAFMKAREALESGKALDRFRRMVEAQGGNQEVVENPQVILPAAERIIPVVSPRDGYVRVDALKLGELVRDLGGGRKSKEDQIDPAVGIELLVRTGDIVSANAPCCRVNSNGKIDDDIAVERALDAFEITDSPIEPQELFID